MDLMEVPSHVTEHFARSGPSLRAFMRHHISGRPMPAPLVQRMRASQSLFEATNLQQQARPQSAVLLIWRKRNNTDTNDKASARAAVQLSIMPQQKNDPPAQEH